MSENVVVEAYAGASYPERPRRFALHGEWIEVDSVVGRKRTPTEIEFRVKGKDGTLYGLVYDFGTREWKISPSE